MQGTTVGDIKGDTRSLDYGSSKCCTSKRARTEDRCGNAVVTTNSSCEDYICGAAGLQEYKPYLSLGFRV